MEQDWYLLTCQLLEDESIEKRTDMSQDDWKKLYYLLEHSVANQLVFTEEVLANPLAVDVLIEVGYNPAMCDNIAVINASIFGHSSTVRLLLSDKRIDPSVMNNLAIRHSAGAGHTEVVQLLLADKRVDPTAVNNQAIRLAIELGHIEMVRLLLADSRIKLSWNIES